MITETWIIFVSNTASVSFSRQVFIIKIKLETKNWQGCLRYYPSRYIQWIRAFLWNSCKELFSQAWATPIVDNTLQWILELENRGPETGLRSEDWVDWKTLRRNPSSRQSGGESSLRRTGAVQDRNRVRAVRLKTAFIGTVSGVAATTRVAWLIGRGRRFWANWSSREARPSTPA